MQQKSNPRQDRPLYQTIGKFIRDVLARINNEQTAELKQRIIGLLNNLPENLQEAIDHTIEVLDQAVLSSQYEAEIQKLESKIRKHIKIEIELKLYYEHLEQRLEEEVKKYAELQGKYLQERFKDEEKTQIKFGSQMVGNHYNSISNIDSNPNTQRNKQSKDYKESSSRIKSKLQFHDMNDFTRRVEIKPFAERTLAQKTVPRQPSNSLKNLKQHGRSRKSDAELIKIIASGKASLRIHHSSSRGSIQANRRSISNSNLRNQSLHRNSQPKLK